MTESARRVTAETKGSPGQKPDAEAQSMKVRTLGLVLLTASILAVAFGVSAPAAPNTANASAVPAPAATPNTANDRSRYVAPTNGIESF